MAALIISNEEMDGIIKIVKSLGDSGLLKKQGVSKTTKNEAKEQKYGIFSVLLRILGAILLRNLLIGKEINSKIPRQ